MKKVFVVTELEEVYPDVRPPRLYKLKQLYKCNGISVCGGEWVISNSIAEKRIAIEGKDCIVHFFPTFVREKVALALTEVFGLSRKEANDIAEAVVSRSS